MGKRANNSEKRLQTAEYQKGTSQKPAGFYVRVYVTARCARFTSAETQRDNRQQLVKNTRPGRLPALKHAQVGEVQPHAAMPYLTWAAGSHAIVYAFILARLLMGF